MCDIINLILFFNFTIHIYLTNIPKYSRINKENYHFTKNYIIKLKFICALF
jgi:hypothetical protein